MAVRKYFYLEIPKISNWLRLKFPFEPKIGGEHVLCSANHPVYIYIYVDDSPRRCLYCTMFVFAGKYNTYTIGTLPTRKTSNILGAWYTAIYVHHNDEASTNFISSFYGPRVKMYMTMTMNCIQSPQAKKKRILIVCEVIIHIVYYRVTRLDALLLMKTICLRL